MQFVRPAEDVCPRKMLVREVLVELEPGERVPEPLIVVGGDVQKVAGDQRGVLGEPVLRPA